MCQAHCAAAVTRLSASRTEARKQKRNADRPSLRRVAAFNKALSPLLPPAWKAELRLLGLLCEHGSGEEEFPTYAPSMKTEHDSADSAFSNPVFFPKAEEGRTQQTHSCLPCVCARASLRVRVCVLH